jgi:hypothetical protein
MTERRTSGQAGVDCIGRAGRRTSMKRLKSVLSKPHWKYGLLTLGSGAWVVGLIDQLSSSAATMKYLLMSLLMVVVAVL